MRRLSIARSLRLALNARDRDARSRPSAGGGHRWSTTSTNAALIAAQLAPLDQHDAVTLDIQMPEMDGF